MTGLVAPVARALGARRGELPAVLLGAAMFFLLFTGYFMLRPVRETMGIAGGVDNLQWLFTGTFVAMLAAMPLFGAIAARVRRRRILPWTYAFFGSHLAAFAVAFGIDPGNAWNARAFYIWLSVFNLLTISVAWSVLTDLFSVEQARRLFGVVAAGASAGGLLGPLLAIRLVGAFGHAGLMWLSLCLLLASAGAASALQRWRDRHPLPEQEPTARSRPLGGSPFAGAGDVARSPYLLGISLFVLLLASVSTFLYFEQARLVEASFPDPDAQTRVFGTLDAIVQTLAILTQLFVTGRIARRLGVGVLLVAVPLVAAAGFVWLAFAPVFAVLAVVMVVRRAGEYALVRPGREMLFTLVPVASKYKAKNFIDTVVYRGADAVSGWAKAGVDALSQHPAVAALAGAGLALAWAATGGALARSCRRRDAPAPNPDGV
ncbi:NTP/NDP exchange transporter [Coralloluteibacterium stylophorae]|uniref:MFS transporter n=1 Tax=Coralloluteibacterium stylophorae TaxID=1776034 RepID=A0A8J7VV42_9GAMM|nr:MFS transporter [Coralloluteibacterium stylophorae]MBS7458724.1 MFS transporter [Coralloluteibacterium stylophorae]